MLSYGNLVRTVHEWANYANLHKVELWSQTSNTLQRWQVGGLPGEGRGAGS